MMPLDFITPPPLDAGGAGALERIASTLGEPEITPQTMGRPDNYSRACSCTLCRKWRDSGLAPPEDFPDTTLSFQRGDRVLIRAGEAPTGTVKFVPGDYVRYAPYYGVVRDDGQKGGGPDGEWIASESDLTALTDPVRGTLPPTDAEDPVEALAAYAEALDQPDWADVVRDWSQRTDESVPCCCSDCQNHAGGCPFDAGVEVGREMGYEDASNEMRGEIDDAYERGFDEGRSSGYSDGYDDGRMAGS